MFLIRNAWRESQVLLQGKDQPAQRWGESRNRRAVAICIGTILIGVGTYGASIGIWQGPRQALYVGIKLPFVILITLLINSLLNGVLAILLGVRLSFSQTTMALLTAFSVFAIIVASLAPITFGIALDLPEPNTPEGAAAHRSLILTHTFIITFAGIISTGRLFRLLQQFATSSHAARHSLVGLLAGNLFAGAQIGFLLRPIFGQPGLKIEFLRSDLFRGNFYESVWRALTHSF